MTNKHHDLYPYKQSLYNTALSCVVYEVQYSFEHKIGILTMSTESCCDMDACISLFKLIDPAVIQIQTHAGETPDTIYSLNKSKDWISFWRD